ncbi:hypothetical protein D3C87_1914420 [compost metagenome]
MRHADLFQQLHGARPRPVGGPFQDGHKAFHDIADGCLVREELKVLEHHAGLAAQALDRLPAGFPPGLKVELVVAEPDRT